MPVSNDAERQFQISQGSSAADEAPAAAPPALTTNQITAGLWATNRYWSPSQFTFSIPTAASTWPTYDPADSEVTTFTPLSAAQAARFRAAIQQWDKLIAPNFTETNDLTNPGNIRIGFTAYSEIQDSWGYATYPPSAGGAASAQAGDIWINSDYKTEDFADYGYDFTATLHEIGHALGLKHSFEGTPIPASYENRRYTIMSYTDMSDLYRVGFHSTGGGGISSDYMGVFAATPMVLDIAAIQARYGADTTTATGDTVYTFSEATPFLYSIYDAGGTDTLDLTGVTRGSIVDLRPGAYSSIGYFSAAAQIAYWQALFPGFNSFIANIFAAETPYTWTDNLGIAFSTTIENAIGGSGADTIIGNSVANRITGKAGADTLTGGAGADTFVVAAASEIAGAGDTITDFETGQDRIDFSGLAGLTFIGQTAFTHVAGQVNFSWSGGATLLQVDTNGDGVADGTITLSNGTFTLSETAAGSRVYLAVVADTTAPTLSSSSPADNATAIAVGANLVLTFSEAVQAGTGAVEIHRSSDGGLVSSIAITDASQVTVSGSTVTINPTADLAAATGYYLRIASGVIRDLAGNAYAGLTTATALNFTTAAAPDLTAPTLSNSTPTDNAANVAVSADIVLTFNEAVQAGSGAVEIRRSADGSLVTSIAVTDTSQVTFSGSTARINPAADLANGVGYYLVIASGVIRDLAGNAYAGLTTATALNFTTVAAGDTTAPHLTGSTPADDATGLLANADLVLTFDEAVQRGVGSFEIHRASDGGLVRAIDVADTGQVTIAGTTVTLNPATDLATDTAYYLTIGAGAVVDLAGNAFGGIAGATALNFATGPYVQQITGTTAAETLTGGALGDRIDGLDGDDVLNGLGGGDRLDGGAGLDKAAYAGAKSDYAWWQALDGSWRVQDLRPGSPEGTDILLSIEQLQFANGVVKIIGATPAESLAYAFENVLRYQATSQADTAYLAGLASAVSGGSQTLAQAFGQIVQRADQTTAVAALTYQFFLGFVPSKGGFDYLVSPTGPNPNNINSAYFQSFSIENRYINFAVNVGAGGEGRAAFQAAYGALSLHDATKLAYGVIFGATPTDAKVDQLLDTHVFVGGMDITRAQYLAIYGGDGLSGLGTKAAVVGFLLTEAAKGDLGTYGHTVTDYLTDLADGAPFLINIVGDYGKPEYVFQPG